MRWCFRQKIPENARWNVKTMTLTTKGYETALNVSFLALQTWHTGAPKGVSVLAWSYMFPSACKNGLRSNWKHYINCPCLNELEKPVRVYKYINFPHAPLNLAYIDPLNGWEARELACAIIVQIRENYEIGQFWMITSWQATPFVY
jgi:hypothetical protein